MPQFIWLPSAGVFLTPEECNHSHLGCMGVFAAVNVWLRQPFGSPHWERGANFNMSAGVGIQLPGAPLPFPSLGPWQPVYEEAMSRAVDRRRAHIVAVATGYEMCCHGWVNCLYLRLWSMLWAGYEKGSPFTSLHSVSPWITFIELVCAVPTAEPCRYLPGHSLSQRENRLFLLSEPPPLWTSLCQLNSHTPPHFFQISILKPFSLWKLLGMFDLHLFILFLFIHKNRKCWINVKCLKNKWVCSATSRGAHANCST